MAPRCMTDPCRLDKEIQSAAIRSQKGAQPVSLPSFRRSSYKNEEWACSDMMQSSCKAIFSQDAKLKPSIKCIDQSKYTSKEKNVEERLSAGSLRKRLNSSRVYPTVKTHLDLKAMTQIKKKRLKISFAETQKHKCHTSPSDDMTIAWYKESDIDQFLNDATARARITNRLMEYATLNESTYNSSTGLTAPKVLKEYLSCPEEIIGIEGFLSAQKAARKSLRDNHVKALMEEQQRQTHEGYDPLLLAERLRNSSTIAAHLAKERALYIVLLD